MSMPEGIPSEGLNPSTGSGGDSGAQVPVSSRDAAGDVAVDSERYALSIGEALVDIVHRTDGSVAEFAGGSPMNVALGLARLGRSSELLTWFGTDAHGQLISDHLAASGVHVSEGSTGAAKTSTAAATLDSSGAASYVFDLEWTVPRAPRSAPPLVIHTGSIAAVLAPGAADVEKILTHAREACTITYDPNARPDLMGSAQETLPTVLRLVALSDVVKVSDEDLEWFAPGQDPIDVAAEWLMTGPAIVIVTRGGDGSTAVTRAGEFHVDAPRTVVADTVGAGDSYMGGLIDGLWSAGLLGADRREALRDIDETTLLSVMEWAAKIAAITVSRPGANPPTRAELG